MNSKKTIVFTGGGTAGHVTPNLALIKKLDRAAWDIHYIGTSGMEKELVSAVEGVTYHEIESGKLRRYASLKTLTMPFHVQKGYHQAKRILKKLKPDVVFSKGGYVSVPVVAAAKGLCPVLTHESDYTPGLANKIDAHFADRVLVTFADTVPLVKGNKGVHTGTPIRPELYLGSREKALAFTGLSGEKPILLVTGGSLGAVAVNVAVREALPALLKTFDVVHLCGKGKVDESISLPGYLQYEYIRDEMADLFAAADVVCSRAGANAVFELLALKKPMLLLPLSAASTRGDQELNADYFKKRGYARVLKADEVSADSVLREVTALYEARETYIETMRHAEGVDGTDAILKLIREAANA
ncbi:MAG: undecaprenyldiphospho-muramoylpentapeptide beta-N-acetylglucosaminyltransferase [Clostridia bacterium]|jgi:UDP-N-acetylglucosamine--N-acetylmuramyl-(pentapeptide) pyrophosphoryl-undecaprenol N-acetylglucosamine transferase|nr:undecaprenyldiphospho-muramoylpentapeptide beta-N-acetylglucosaminyltransferase [Clostridia bacterium]